MWATAALSAALAVAAAGLTSGSDDAAAAPPSGKGRPPAGKGAARPSVPVPNPDKPVDGSGTAGKSAPGTTSSAGETGSDDGSTKTRRPASDAAFLPKLKFPKGTTERFRWVITTRQSLGGGTVTKAIQQNIVETYEGPMTVVEEGTSGGGVVEMTFEKVKADLNLGGSRIAFDSARPDTKPSALVAGYAAMAGVKLRLTFDAAGRLTAVSGAKAVQDKVADGLEEKNRHLAAAAYGDAALKARLAEQLCDLLSSEPVRVGQSRVVDSERTLPGAGGIRMRTTYTLQGVDTADGVVVLRYGLSGEGQLTGNPEADPTARVDVKTESFNQTGTGRFDLKRGWVRDRKESRTAVASMKVGESKQPMRLQLTWTSEFTMTAEGEAGATGTGSETKPPAGGTGSR